MTIYDKLGVRTIINLAGPKTRLSGSIMPREVLDSMVEASADLVDMEYLQAKASEIISQYTGAEAGVITTGASAGLTLATAACITGLDISKMERPARILGGGPRGTHRRLYGTHGLVHD